jgi:hypothetical protein
MAHSSQGAALSKPPISVLGSAGVSRVGFGVSPKQSFLKYSTALATTRQEKSHDGETPSSTRETRALPRAEDGGLESAAPCSATTRVRHSRRERGRSE